MEILEDTIQDQLASFGQSLRDLRLERGWTLDRLAGLSGLSKGFLSRLESGDRQVSIAVALTLAGIFQVSVSALFEPPPETACCITRGGGAPSQTANGLTFWALAHGSQSFKIQPLRVIVPWDRTGDEHQTHSGEEWIYVLSGRLALSLDGSLNELEAGDAIHFDASRPHRLIARDFADAEILLVAVSGAKPGTGPYLP